MMHEDWVKYDDWVYHFVLEKLKSNHPAATTVYFKKTIADVLLNRGTVFNAKGNIPEALKLYHESHNIYEETGDKWRISGALANIGSVYENQGDTKKALEYYNKSLVLAEEIQDKSGLAFSYSSIGSIYEGEGDLVKALTYYQKAAKESQQSGDKSKISSPLTDIGRVYEIQNDYDSALIYYRKALQFDQETGDKDSEAHSLACIGFIVFNQGKISEAEENGTLSLKIGQELGHPNAISIAAELLSEIYGFQSKGMEAYEMHKLHIKMRDSLNNEANQMVTAQHQAKYEYDKIAAIETAKHESLLAIEQEEKEKQQILTYSISGGLVLLIFFFLFVINRLRITRKQKHIIENQKATVELAHDELEEKNQEIMDSINYAKRIQTAILPPAKIVKEYLNESFILYKPKDIVAGDFYWLEHKEGKVLFASADCTGHGVPGAMVSVICNNGLNRSVREHGLTDPGEILDKTREIVIQEFEKSEEEMKDGMDIALCSLEGDILQYSGANNPLWIFRNGKIIETKANKQPIGKFDKQTAYTTHTFTLEKGDTFYIFTDGFVDQFGGEKGKKFKAKAFKDLLMSIQSKSMEEQKTIIDDTFEFWRGELEQIDDICIIGVRV